VGATSPPGAGRHPPLAAHTDRAGGLRDYIVRTRVSNRDLQALVVPGKHDPRDSANCRAGPVQKAYPRNRYRGRRS